MAHFWLKYLEIKCQYFECGLGYHTEVLQYLEVLSSNWFLSIHISSEQLLAQLIKLLIKTWANFLRNQLEEIYSGTVRILWFPKLVETHN
jgi:hypothetical protein